MKRAWWSFIILLILYFGSLGAELLCNDHPILKFGDRQILPLINCSPYALVPESEIAPHLREITKTYVKKRVAGIVFDAELNIVEAENQTILGMEEDIVGHNIREFWPGFSEEAIASRWQGQSSFRKTLLETSGANGAPNVTFVFSPTGERDNPRTTMRGRIWLPDGNGGYLTDTITKTEKETAQYPFRPFPGHWLGLDDAGRDVFARLLYGLRIALNFGIILVACSLIIGSAFGMIQGYYGGITDIAGQRLTEIWSALPFLYIMILLGSIYGSSFWLLLFCYAIFNWISISYYTRGEMLRLRKSAFVESAKCLGLPAWKIILHHILPNSLVPIITFFPFSLVGAIGALAALDYLGFGLPAPTPSIGQLLQQAQVYRDAWWLILFPSLLLFIIMLLGVFIGEGIRNAFDPRRQNRLQ